MKVEKLKKISPTTVRDLNRLIVQLCSVRRGISKIVLRKILDNENVHLCVVRDGPKIVGMGALVMINTLSGTRARIEDVVVDESQRGKGFGKRLTLELIALARKLKVSNIELSSRPNRITANALYRNIGFIQKDTNVYEMKF